MTKSVKEWPKSERPRERLLSQGPAALSDAELLAVILRNGVQGKDVTSLARELLAQFGGMRGLLSADPNELQKTKGLGQANKDGYRFRRCAIRHWWCSLRVIG